MDPLLEDYLDCFRRNDFRFPVEGTTYDPHDFFFELIKRSKDWIVPLLDNALRGQLPEPRALEQHVHSHFVFYTHGPTRTNTKGERTGLQGTMLDTAGEAHALHEAAIMQQRPALLMAADSLRTMHYALLLSHPHDEELRAQLREMALRIDAHHDAHRRISLDDYVSLAGLCLDRNVLVTSGLRTVCGGPSELWPVHHYSIFPEGSDERDASLRKWQNFKQWYVAGCRESGMALRDAQDLYGIIESHIKASGDIMTTLEHEGHVLSENRFLMAHRAYQVLGMFSSPQVMASLEGQDVHFIIPSGFLDGAFSYFRHRLAPQAAQVSMRDKPDHRGERVCCKVNPALLWLNDPAYGRGLTANAGNDARRALRRSLDMRVQHSPLFPSDRTSEEHARYSAHFFSEIPLQVVGTEAGRQGIALEQLLAMQVPVLIYGHPGTGKTWLRTKIVLDHEMGLYPQTKGYALVTLTAEELNDELRFGIPEDGDRMRDYLLRRASGQARWSCTMPPGAPLDLRYLFLIDDLHDCSPPLLEPMREGLSQICAEGHKVVAFARPFELNKRPDAVPGFSAHSIDRRSISSNVGSFVTSHFPGDPADECSLAGQIQRRLSACHYTVSGHYQTLALLSELVHEDPFQLLRCIDVESIRHIAVRAFRGEIPITKGLVMEGALTAQVFEDVLSEKGQLLSPNKLYAEVSSTKRRLAAIAWDFTLGDMSVPPGMSSRLIHTTRRGPRFLHLSWQDYLLARHAITEKRALNPGTISHESAMPYYIGLTGDASLLLDLAEQERFEPLVASLPEMPAVSLDLVRNLLAPLLENIMPLDTVRAYAIKTIASFAPRTSAASRFGYLSDLVLESAPPDLAYYRLGLIHYNTEHYRLAAASFSEVLEQEDVRPWLAAQAHVQLGRSFRLCNSQQLAADHFQTALQLFSETRGTDYYLALFEYALVIKAINGARAAWDIYKECHGFFSGDGRGSVRSKDDDRNAARCKIQLAEIHLHNWGRTKDDSPDLQHLGEAERLYSFALPVLEEQHYLRGVAECYLGLSCISERMGDFEESEELAHLALNVSQQVYFPRRAAYCHVQLAKAQRAQGKLDHAIHHLMVADSIWQQIDNYLGAARTQHELSTTYRLMGLEEQAIEAGKSSRSLFMAYDIRAHDGLWKPVDNTEFLSADARPEQM